MSSIQEEELITLTKLRTMAGLSQRQMSIALEVNYNTISAWETGKHEPRLTSSQWFRLRDTLKCSFEELDRAIQNQKRLAIKSN